MGDRKLVARVKGRLPYRVQDAFFPVVPRVGRPWASWTFSQTGEDVLIDFAFAQLGVQRPTYLDVGAFRPFQISNTARLYLAGSRGINVDPDPDTIVAFKASRPEDLNLNLGCAGAPGRLTFHRMTAPALNSFSAGAVEEAVRESHGRISVASTLQVDVRPVADILKQHHRETPDLLSLDVEGLDLEILRTLPDWPGLPSVICVETISYSESGHGVKSTAIPELLEGLGYMTFADTYHNTIFVPRDRWRA